MPDNFQLILKSDSFSDLKSALEIIIDHAPGKSADYYADHPKHGLVFFWSKPSDTKFMIKSINDNGWGPCPEEDDKPVETKIRKLPFKLTKKNITEFVTSWLDQAEYPEEPDIDGSNKKGFYLTTGDFWGHISENHYSILQCAPYWLMYGK